jgi:hypothetical protein
MSTPEPSTSVGDGSTERPLATPPASTACTRTSARLGVVSGQAASISETLEITCSHASFSERRAMHCAETFAGGGRCRKAQAVQSRPLLWYTLADAYGG